MKRRSLAWVVTALGLTAAVALATVGTAGPVALLAADDRGIVHERGQPGQQDPDPRVTNPGPVAPDPGTETPCPVAETPDPRVTNPGPVAQTTDPGTGTPCPVAEDPTPGADGGTPPADQAGPHASAPTEGLRTLANALVVENGSVSLFLAAPPGLTATPTEVSVLYGAVRRTESYSNDRGVDFNVYVPPLDGSRRTEYLAITLTELTPERAHYSIVSQRVVEPVFDVTISPLYIISDYDSFCDTGTGADPTVSWVDPTGVQGRYELSDSYGYVSGFYRSFTRASVGSDLTLPTLEWYDRDPGGPTGENVLPRGTQRLLPLPYAIPLPIFDVAGVPADTERRVVETLPDAGGDGCSAQLTYTITYTLLRN